jgi:hypothetical protein
VGYFWLIPISTVTFIAGLLLMPVLIVRIPSDYFVRERSPRWRFEQHHPLLRVALMALKNLLGATMVIAGAIMIVTPGPGIICILIGAMLLDIPGKRALERKLISLPKVFTAINRLRARYGHPPLVPPVEQRYA